MTSSEYNSAYAEARRKWPGLTAATMRKIKAVYIEAGKKVADILREGALDGKQLSFETQLRLDQALLEGSAAIGKIIREEVPMLLGKVSTLSVAIETEFLKDALGGVTAKVSPDGFEKMFTRAASQAARASLNVVDDKGLSFWGRVPNVSKYFGDDVVNMVRASISQGRDLGKIAADINKYIKDGKEGTIHRWGDVIAPDSSRLLKRVSEKVDYRALRLARSELGRGIEKVNLELGAVNPGTLDLVDWVRLNSIDWGCVCPANAANGPYPRAEYPDNRHPNCFCFPRNRLKDGTAFRNDLQAWINGDSNAGLDQWYRETYLPAQY